MKIIKIWSIAILVLSIVLLALCVLGSLEVIDISPAPLNYICPVIFAASAVITLPKQKDMAKNGEQNKSQSKVLIILFSVFTVALLLGFVLTVNQYSFTAEGAAEKRLGGENSELLYSQSLSDEYSVFVFSPGERYETLLVKKGAFLWHAVAYSQIPEQSGEISLLSFKPWPEKDGGNTFIALQCVDERATYAEIGSYRIDIEDEITVLTAMEELDLQYLKGEAFDESGDLIYQLSAQPDKSGEYIVPVWVSVHRVQ